MMVSNHDTMLTFACCSDKLIFALSTEKMLFIFSSIDGVVRLIEVKPFIKGMCFFY